MALAHNIKPDRGLTRRMLMTGFFLVVLYAVLIGVLFIFLKSLVLILVIAFGLLFCQYFFSDKIAMFAMHAKEVTPEEAPELHGVIDRLCRAGRHAQAAGGHRRHGHTQRLCHRSQSQGGGGVRHVGALAATRRSPKSKPCWPTRSRMWLTATWRS